VVHFDRLKRYKGVDKIGWVVNDVESGEKLESGVTKLMM
jgi:hypothetical protein